MVNTSIEIILSSWNVLLDSAPYMLFGFIMAGLLKAFIPDDFVAKHLGTGNITSVIKASALGVPLPLCSCGVLPAASGLREQGASKGAAASFLVSTPETGVDSIAITYALLDPIMTLVRPISAFITAVVTGVGINLLDRENDKDHQKAKELPLACSGDCCDSKGIPSGPKTLYQKLQHGMKFSFGELFDDIGRWFLLGVVIAGAISVFISPVLIERYLGNTFVSMIVVLAVSMPLYICATASTPIAAVLILKGLNPGAALVLLLAGPATNAAAVTVISRILGRRSVIIYIVSIIICSLLLGYAVNYLYQFLGVDLVSTLGSHAQEEKGIGAIVSALVILMLISRSFILQKK